MSGKGCPKLPDKPGGKVPGRGKVLKIRTIVPKRGKYMHVRVMSKKGPRGGTTLASGVQTKRSTSARARHARLKRKQRGPG